MTLPRIPDTAADAVLQIAGRIGYPAAALVAGRSVACIRDWTNEATTSCPSFVQAVALDAAYLASGGENAPLHDAYAAQLKITVEERTACARALSSEVATAARECGDLIAASLSVCQAGHSPNDVQRALLEADEAETAVAAIKRRLFSFLRAGRESRGFPPMSRIARPRQPSFDCPHCRSRAIVRSSAQVTSLVRELDYACTNHRCGHTFVAQLEAVRTIVPSAMPSATVHLPFGNRNLGPKRLPVPANDDNRAPANDAGPDVAQAPDPMSG